MTKLKSISSFSSVLNKEQQSKIIAGVRYHGTCNNGITFTYIGSEMSDDNYLNEIEEIHSTTCRGSGIASIANSPDQIES